MGRYEFVLSHNRRHKISLPSVTEVISATLAKPQLVGWAYRQTLDSLTGALSQIDLDLLQDWPLLQDSDEVDDWLKQNRLRPEDVADEASDKGVAGHAFLKRLAVTHESGQSARQVAVEHRGSDNGHESAISDWWLKRHPIPRRSEETVWSLRYGFAGTLDLVWQASSDGVVTLTDLKCRQADRPCGVSHKTDEAARHCHGVGGPYRSDHVQTGGYKIALAESQGIIAERRTVLVAKEDGTWFEESSDHVPTDVFLRLLETYKMLEGVR